MVPDGRKTTNPEPTIKELVAKRFVVTPGTAACNRAGGKGEKSSAGF